MGDAGGESVRVIVRLRPEEDTHSGGRRNVRPGGNTAADGQGLAGSCVLSVEQQKLTIVDPGSHDKNKEVKQAHDFTFDHVFGPAATQSEVFETVKPLVHATVDGKSIPLLVLTFLCSLSYRKAFMYHGENYCCRRGRTTEVPRSAYAVTLVPTSPLVNTSPITKSSLWNSVR